MNLLIPTVPNAAYTLNVELDSNKYELRFRWNVTSQAWYLDITGLTNSVEKLGLKLVTNYDVLSPFGLPDLGSLTLIDVTGENREADFDNFSSELDFKLIYTEVS